MGVGTGAFARAKRARSGDRHLQRRSSVVALGLGSMKRFRRWRRNQPLPAKRQVTASQAAPMKFQRIEFSWRAAFIGLYMTPERDKVWVTILPFFPLYFKRS